MFVVNDLKYEFLFIDLKYMKAIDPFYPFT